MTPAGRPRISVIIPTYNESGLLRASLTGLARQRLPRDEFEVVVADDGSADGTAAVVESFADRLRLQYHFQPDLGWRAPAARNNGARLAAAPLLSFLDTGNLVGPDYLRHHLAAAAGGPGRRAVFGYAYGYRPEDPTPGLAGLLARLPPEEVVRRHGQDPAFFDDRHAELAGCDFDLRRRAVPWQFCWGMSCTVRADDFWAVGGFDEEFRSWGIEDIEFGYRLHRRGVVIEVSRDGWVIESPGERDLTAMWRSAVTNMARLYRKHPVPANELGWVLLSDQYYWEWQHEAERLREWTRTARDLDVTDELRAAARRLRPDQRVAVFGCGGAVPAELPAPAVLLDVDADLLDRAVAGGRHQGYHALGLRLPLPDQSMDVAILTSRLAGLRDRWGEQLAAEARRVARQVREAATDVAHSGPESGPEPVTSGRS